MVPPRTHTTRAIALRTVKLGDHSRILKAWTEEFGARSYLVRITKRGGVTDATLQALNRLEIVAKDDPEKDLLAVKEIRVERPYLNLRNDPVRGVLALFAQEVLYKVLRTGSADREMDAFLRDALDVMDSEKDVRHYPLVFLLQLSRHLGFFPSLPDPGHDRFDLKEGQFLRGTIPHGHTLGPPLSLGLAAVMECDLRELDKLDLSGSLRRELLDQVLLYYRMHVEGFGEMHSPEVLKQVLK